MLHIEALKENPIYQGMMKEFNLETQAIDDQLKSLYGGIVDESRLHQINHMNGRKFELEFVQRWLGQYEAALKANLEKSPLPTIKRAGDR